jgi:hypothetical protein
MEIILMLAHKFQDKDSWIRRRVISRKSHAAELTVERVE